MFLDQLMRCLGAKSKISSFLNCLLYLSGRFPFLHFNTQQCFGFLVSPALGLVRGARVPLRAFGTCRRLGPGARARRLLLLPLPLESVHIAEIGMQCQFS